MASIKTSALFLGDMSELHKEKSLKLKEESSYIDDNLKFLKEMIFKEKVESAQVKEGLFQSSHNFEGLFMQA